MSRDKRSWFDQRKAVWDYIEFTLGLKITHRQHNELKKLLNDCCDAKSAELVRLLRAAQAHFAVCKMDKSQRTTIVRSLKKKSHAQRRRELWECNPACYWCGTITVIDYSMKDHNGKAPYNLATLDHLVSRLKAGGPRPNPYGKKAQTMVLACWKCNNERNKIEQEDLKKLHESL